MYTIKPWVKAPTKWILEGQLAEDFTWGNRGRANRSAGTAALMLWITLATQAQEVQDETSSLRTLKARLTYTSLREITGLSRTLISSGIHALEATGLITVEQDGRANTYQLNGYDSGKHWCKLPCRVLYSLGRYRVIEPFKHFQKRTVCELDALKLYLYFAAIRHNLEPFSQAKYETIYEHTGVLEKRIARANSLLLNIGMLAQIKQEPPKNGTYFPNHYYLGGYKDLFVGRALPLK